MADVKSVLAEALGMRREISRLLRLSTYNHLVGHRDVSLDGLTVQVRKEAAY